MITLSSDFGSPYPAAMKGAMLRRTDARLVDVAHDFPRQDVRTAAFWLREVLPQFPPAVHLAVVDPGVGTDRAVLAVAAGEHVLVGPDNGLLIPAARRIASAEPSVYTVDPGDPASSTFHGRDVFAPLAADIHDGRPEIFDVDDRFTPARDHASIDFPDPTRHEDEIHGEVLVVDGFGNAVTNVPGHDLDDLIGTSIRVNDVTTPVRRTYGGVPPGNRLVTIGSHGNVELSVNQGRGDEAFDVDVGSSVVFEFE